MNTPEYYRSELERLGVISLKVSVSTKTQATQLLKDLTQKQKQLRFMKSQITQDEKEIRAQYQEQQASAGTSSSAVVSLFGKRKLAGSIRADAKRRVASQRDQELAPYASLKLLIDDLIIQMDGAKLQLRDYLQQPDEA